MKECCCVEECHCLHPIVFNASAEATGKATTSTGDLVTATATASANSYISEADAFQNAYFTALQNANIEAQNSANIIDQTLEIVETEDIGGNGGVVTKSLIPDKDLAYDLGSPTHRFRDLYLSGNSAIFNASIPFKAADAVTISAPIGSDGKPAFATTASALVLSKGTGTELSMTADSSADGGKGIFFSASTLRMLSQGGTIVVMMSAGNDGKPNLPPGTTVGGVPIVGGQGATGATGAQGAQGAQGNQGNQGDTGPGLSTINTYPVQQTTNPANFNMVLGTEGVTGSFNTGLGVDVLLNNITGSYNVATGNNALFSNTTGNNNVAQGYQALYSNTTGFNNTAQGYQALFTNTTGKQNVAQGVQALYFNTTGSQNIGVGNQALNKNTTGYENIAVGKSALSTNTEGIKNVAVGGGALISSTGDNNVAIGFIALSNSSNSGSKNTSLGNSAGSTITTGSNNTCIGSNALGSSSVTTTGSNITVLGAEAGNTITTGTNVTCIGFGAEPSGGAVSNEITLGNSSIGFLRCQVQTISALSDQRDKKNIAPLPVGLEFISELNPVEFDWNMRDGGKVDIHEFGFIAQELKSAQEKLGVKVPNLVYEANPDKLEASYGTLLPVMVKAIQELKELCAKHDTRIAVLESTLSTLSTFGKG